jgi:hypothetical protein
MAWVRTGSAGVVLVPLSPPLAVPDPPPLKMVVPPEEPVDVPDPPLRRMVVPPPEVPVDRLGPRLRKMDVPPPDSDDEPLELDVEPVAPTSEVPEPLPKMVPVDWFEYSFSRGGR